MMQKQTLLLNLFRISNISICEGNAEAFFHCLSILKNTIPSAKIRKIYNEQYNKVLEYNGDKFDRKPTLLLLNLYEHIVDLDSSESEDNEMLYDAIFHSFDDFIMSGSRKHQTSIVFNEWSQKIAANLSCPVKILDFPDPETIDWIILFQRGLTKEALIHQTRLEERSLRKYAKKYHAVLSTNSIYSIPSVENKVTLELNTSEAGELLFSLCRAYHAEATADIADHHKEKIGRLALSIWQSIHSETKSYLKKSYGNNKHKEMSAFYSLLDRKVETHNPTFIDEVKDAYSRLDNGDDNSLYYSLIDACKATISGRPFKLNLTAVESNNDNLLLKINNVYLSDNQCKDHRYISYSKDGSNWKHILRNNIKKIERSF